MKRRTYRCPRCGRLRRAQRNSRDASRYSYGGVRMCPCPGESRPPQMLTYDPEDDRFSRDPDRGRKYVSERAYSKIIDGMLVRFTYHPRGETWSWDFIDNNGVMVLPGSGDGKTPNQVEAKARYFIRKGRGIVTWPPKRDMRRRAR